MNMMMPSQKEVVVINKLGRDVIVKEFTSLMNNLTAETVNINQVNHLLNVAAVNGSKVTKALTKLEDYAKVWGLKKLTEREALTILHGSVPTNPEDIAPSKQILQYLINGSQRAKELLDIKPIKTNASFRPDFEKIIDAVNCALEDSGEQEFSWAEVSNKLLTKFDVKPEQLKAYQNSFLSSKRSKELWEKIPGLTNGASRWRLLLD